ncbi:MAG: hypothetical protein M0C28_44955 [Candidatus Moduliflexus flocculans]|nr:hypothetical protein [Candidatus Moduliflexus flocculans]
MDKKEPAQGPSPGLGPRPGSPPGPATCRASPTRPSSPSPPVPTRSSRPCARRAAASSSSRARRAAARAPRSRRCASRRAAASRGRIGVTQPRRIAAMTIAHRIAEELGEPLGRSVGYKIRFQDTDLARTAYIKVMTDGILLAETQGRPHALRDYDTHHHRRGPRAQPQHRLPPGLSCGRSLDRAAATCKLVITSATLDTEKFSKAFDERPGHRGQRPDLPGRGRATASADADEAEDKDYVDAGRRGRRATCCAEKPPGDILVFMPTEQDILETCRDARGPEVRRA